LATAPAPEQDDGGGQTLTPTAVVVAVLVLIAFTALVGYLLSEVDESNETRWARLTWIFTSVEAIAFGAAGALFGSTIQRQRAEKAETAAKENAKDAANGRALAAAIKAEQPAQAGSGFESLGTGASTDAAAVAHRHAALARELFP
jgi:lysylphosphatidylglycerol synthetase-like protein (DUF2156 family)